MLNKDTKICIIANPTAGQGRAEKVARAAQDHFRQLGYSADLRFTTERGHGTVLSRETSESGYEVIIAVGGDGTLSEVINGMAGSRCKLGVIPGGTANDFAKEMGFAANLRSAITIITSGTTRRIDLGRTGSGKYFLNMAGVGFDATVIENIDLKLKQWLKDGAYIVAAVKALIPYKSPKLTIEVDGDRHEGSFVVIGNARYYGGILSITARADNSDGYLDVCIFHGTEKAALYKYLVGVVSRTHLSFKDVTYLRTREVRIASDRPTLIQADGDLVGELPMEFTIAPGILEVIVP